MDNSPNREEDVESGASGSEGGPARPVESPQESLADAEYFDSSEFDWDEVEQNIQRLAGQPTEQVNSDDGDQGDDSDDDADCGAVGGQDCRSNSGPAQHERVVHHYHHQHCPDQECDLARRRAQLHETAAQGAASAAVRTQARVGVLESATRELSRRVATLALQLQPPTRPAVRQQRQQRQPIRFRRLPQGDPPRSDWEPVELYNPRRHGDFNPPRGGWEPIEIDSPPRIRQGPPSPEDRQRNGSLPPLEPLPRAQPRRRHRRQRQNIRVHEDPSIETYTPAVRRNTQALFIHRIADLRASHPHFDWESAWARVVRGLIRDNRYSSPDNVEAAFAIAFHESPESLGSFFWGLTVARLRARTEEVDESVGFVRFDGDSNPY